MPLSVSQWFSRISGKKPVEHSSPRRSHFDAFKEWITTPDWTASRKFLEEHPDLLSDESLRYVEELGDAARELREEEDLAAINAHRKLLASVRRDGIAAVYDGLQFSELLERWNDPRTQRLRPAERIPLLERLLTLTPRTRVPELWAQIQGNLGVSYAENFQFQPAADCFRAALDVFRRDADPEQWGQTHWNLSGALFDLAQNLNRFERIPIQVEALASDRAMREQKPGTPLTMKRQRALLSVGTHFFSARDWAQAADYLSTALDGFDAMYPALTASGREWEGESQADLTAQLAYALVRTRRPAGALAAASALERGRARTQSFALRRQEILAGAAAQLTPELYVRLREATNRLDVLALPDYVPNTMANRDRLSKKKAKAFIDKVFDTERQQGLSNSEAIRDYNKVLSEIRQSFPEFPSADLPRDQALISAASLLEADEGLAYFAHTSLGAVAILISPRSPDLDGPQATGWCDERLTNTALRAALARQERRIWGWKTDGLLPAQYKVENLEGAVRAAIEMLGATDGVAVKLAEGCRSLGLNRLILIPCGLFGLLPLHAAPIRAGTDEPAHPLLDEVEIRFAPSARMWAFCRSRAAPTALKSPNALIVADPLPRPTGLPRLRAAEAEAEIVSVTVSGEADGRMVRVEQEGATRDSVLAALRESGSSLTHVHFACHGFVHLTEPQRSGIVLAGGAQLTVRDLIDPTGARFEHLKLVVLSACQSGLHGIDLPDEVVGLPSGWLQAGAATVIASLWPVSDTATLALMTKFYELHLVDGLEARTALWLAQRWLRGLPSWRDDFQRAGAIRAAQGIDVGEARQRAGPTDRRRPWDSPVYWAAFVASGL